MKGNPIMFERIACVLFQERDKHLSFSFDLIKYKEIYSIIISVIVVIAIFLVEKFSKTLITRFSKRIELKKHLENILKLVSRIIVYSVGITILLEIWGLPTEWFLSVSALSGAAIGFASTQTIGNLLAGLYIMVSKPFEVYDYVKIGDREGEVREITLNYVKILTPTFTTIEIPNRVVLNSIIDLRVSDELIDYSFPMSFAGKVYATSWIPLTDLLEKIINPTLEMFWESHNNVLSKIPEVSVSELAFLSRTLRIRMFLPKGKADRLYNLRPELQKMILNRLDEYRKDIEN
jgi:small conductance mechanosensitive channel